MCHMPYTYIGGRAQGAAVQPKDTYKNTYDGTYALHVYIICLTRMYHMPSPYIGGCAQGAAVQLVRLSSNAGRGGRAGKNSEKFARSIVFVQQRYWTLISEKFRLCIARLFL